MYLIFFDMKKKIVFFSLLSVFMLITVGCQNSKDNTDPENTSVTGLNDSEKINKFVVNCVESMYLWESETDWTKYNNKNTFSTYSDHFTLFDKFIYKDDAWSMLTENIASIKEEFSGVTTTYGYDLIFFRFSNDNSYFAIVMFNYPGSPSERAGLKRGDIILAINGNKITESNYIDLFYSSSISIKTGRLEEQHIVENPGSISMSAKEMYLDPINKTSIIVKGDHKIGYLCYTDYVNTSEKDLYSVFADFKNKGVTDVVLDLRYNGGGHAQTAQRISSVLAPSSVVKGKNVYLSHKWNDLWTSLQDAEDLNIYFDPTLPVNMDLKKLYVLTSENSASASEATIIGLKPYLELTLIGETTSGKYCGGYLLSPEDYYEMFPEKGINKSYYSNFINWGMYIMIYRYSNKNGYPSFISGIPPDIQISEDYFDLKPFGDEADPLLGQAIEEITGVKYVKPYSSTKNVIQYKIVPEMSQKRVWDDRLVDKDAFMNYKRKLINR